MSVLLATLVLAALVTGVVTAVSVIAPTPAHAAGPTTGAINTWSDGAAQPLGIAMDAFQAMWTTNFAGDSISYSSGGTTETFRGAGISGPSDITAGPDGGMWFTNKTGSSIGRVNTVGDVATFTGVDVHAPDNIELGADGALWFVNTSTGTIGRVTTSGAFTTITDPAIGSPYALAAGPNGAMWFTSRSPDRIGFITGAGAITTFPVTQRPGRIVAGTSEMFFTTDTAIGRITTGGAVTYTTSIVPEDAQSLPVVQANPIDLAVPGNGFVWFLTAANQIGLVNQSLSSAGVSRPFPANAWWTATPGRITTAPGYAVFTTGDQIIPVTPAQGVAPAPYAFHFGANLARSGPPQLGPITTGPSGALWYASTAGLASIAPDLSTSTLPTGAVTPTGSLVTGPDGALWFTATNGIGRVTTTGTVTSYSSPSFSGAKGLTVGPDGALWFTATTMTPGTQGGVGRITTAGAITTFPHANAVAPDAIVAGPDGALWFAATGSSKVGRITTAGAMTFFAGPNQPTDLAVGGDGAIWYVNSGTASIGRMTVAGAASVVTTAIPTPRHIARDTAGTMWITSADGKLSSLTMAGVVARFTPTVADPNGIALGPDGSMWFTNGPASSTRPTIGHITITGTPSLALRPTDGDHQVTVAWDAIEGGSPITAVTVTASPGGATCSWTGGPQQCTVSGLTNGTAYRFTATATNASGTADSGPSAPATPAGTPFAPVTVTVTPGSDFANLGWTPGADSNGAPVTGVAFRAYRAGVLEREGYSSTSPAVVPNLVNGATYRFEMAFVTRKGTSASTSSAPTVISIPGAPRAPGFPTVTPGPFDASTGWAQATVSWWPQAGVTSAIVTPIRNGYRLPPVTVSGARNSVLVTGLEYTQHTFEIVLVNSAGAGPRSLTQPLVIVRAPDPSSVAVVGGNASATVSWAAPGPEVNGAIVTPIKDGLVQAPVSFAGNATSQVVTGLTNGSTYFFYVQFTTATGGPGRSGAPTSQVVVGAPKRVTFLKAVPGAGRVTLSWWPVDMNGSPVLRYTVWARQYGSTAVPRQFTIGAGNSLVYDGLTPGATYDFMVTATNQWGTGPDSALTAPVVPT